jgi:hypothetical protein
MPRLRQAVLAARDLEPAIEHLRHEFGLGMPYRDPAVAYFGLTNAVFAIGDTFLEVVCPMPASANAASRRLERSGGAQCGYMAMLQIDDLAAGRERASAANVREVFEIELEDIAEVHLHPGDIQGAIVSLSVPQPAGSWRWGGAGWQERAVPGRVTGITIAVADPDAVSARWTTVAGGQIQGCDFVHDDEAPGIVEIRLETGGVQRTIRPGSH